MSNTANQIKRKAGNKRGAAREWKTKIKKSPSIARG
jgi:hypothetical protein